ncbi:MAG: C10 family peptidase, partial [Bacteroidales bacterium]
MSKINKIFTSFVIFLVLALNVQAEPVSREEVKKVANRVIELYNTSGTRAVAEVTAHQLENGATAYYLVELQPTGWVIVSADDILKPVIGFSFDNQLEPFDQWEWSAKVWFSKIDKHIGLALENPDLEKNEGWTSLYSSGYLKSTTIQEIKPIIKVNWDQGSGWNRYSPADSKGPGGHAYIGCVSVCMAQAMSVYEYPAYPKGEHGYTHDDYGYLYVNYDNQPAYDWSNMSASYSDNENARLLYHLAVAVDMDFGADGSGAYTRKTPSVMKEHFGYSESAKYEYRVNFTDAQWKQKLIDELVQGRPLIYAGDGNNNEPGHAFNVDGVKSDGNYFHLNWGWSGSGNGYYTLDALIPNGQNFSFDQAAVFGIKPTSAGPYNITLPVQSVYDKQSEGTFVSKVEVADEDENNTYTYVLKGRFNVFLDDYG